MSDEQAARDLYDAVATAYDALLPDLTHESPEDEAELRAFADGLEGPVLDAGCGTGRVVRSGLFGDRVVVGVDVSLAVLRVARAAGDARLAQARLSALPAPTGRLGGVLAWYSIVHTAPGDLDEVLGEMARVLRPGGRLLIGAHSGHGERVDDTEAYGQRVARTTHRHDPDDLARRAARAGLTVTRLARRPARPGERSDQTALHAVRA